jgi:hypothetical protein
MNDRTMLFVMVVGPRMFRGSRPCFDWRVRFVSQSMIHRIEPYRPVGGKWGLGILMDTSDFDTDGGRVPYDVESLWISVDL